MTCEALIPLAACTTPVAAFLLRRAGAPIPARTAVVLTAVGLAVAAWRADGRWLALSCVLTVFAVPLALADIGHLRLPDVLTLPAYPAFAAALLLSGDPPPLARALMGALLFGALHVLVHWRAPDSLGLGDVKLAPPLGALLAASSWAALVLAALASAALTALVGAVVRLRGRPGAVPHGPSLLAATWLCVVFRAPPG